MRRIGGFVQRNSPIRRYAASWISLLGDANVMKKKTPTFKDEDAEREFWATADSTEYIDWSKARRIVLPNFRQTLKKSTSRKQPG
jgi:CopG antitoxin of type II toxin-antitoxin system